VRTTTQFIAISWRATPQANNANKSFAEGCGKGGISGSDCAAFDWSAFEALLAPIHASIRDAPHYPPLTMFKILRLQE
jgi:hypothetical protein